ncbi:hypothetical protein MKW94_011963 [Papaver nudicaule]|uniref:RING-type domain-containing protein n=1 Tax=Papaver nudicaule TaxID=74823 RepID=A0AA41RSV2_PAPNU|nr:hypothetical protein [Papaver nudicaule]
MAMEIITINSSNSSSWFERLPAEYQMIVAYPADSSPRYSIQLNVEQYAARAELELSYDSTAEEIKYKIQNKLHEFKISDMDYVEGISERLSVDAAAQLREAATQSVPVRIIDFVKISFRVDVTQSWIDRLERMRYVQGEDNEACRCVICMDGVSSTGEDEVIKIPCAHVLHSDCLARWLRLITPAHCAVAWLSM